MSKYFVISGNIGSGKSTLAKQIAEYFSIELYPEPYAENPFLEEVYKDSRGAAFPSQMFFLLEHWRSHLEVSYSQSVAVKDSSIYDGFWVHAKALREFSRFPDNEWNLYSQFFALASKQIEPPSIIFYLDEPVNILADRVTGRARVMELGIDKPYLSKLEYLYSRYISDHAPAKVVRVDVALKDRLGFTCDKLQELFFSQEE